VEDIQYHLYVLDKVRRRLEDARVNGKSIAISWHPTSRKPRDVGHPARFEVIGRAPWERGFRCSIWLLLARKAAYNNRMEISLAPELEAKLNRIASQAGKAPDEVVREVVASYLDHEEWFRQEVGKGLASLDQGKTVSHEDVRRQMDRILGS